MIEKIIFLWFAVNFLFLYIINGIGITIARGNRGWNFIAPNKSHFIKLNHALVIPQTGQGIPNTSHEKHVLTPVIKENITGSSSIIPKYNKIFMLLIFI